MSSVEAFPEAVPTHADRSGSLGLLGRPRSSEVAVGPLLAALHKVEALPPGASGTFVVGRAERPYGTIFVERRRVCWIAGRGMSRRLTQILREHCSLQIDSEDLEEIFARCRRDHDPLGETLVLEGLISSAQLRAAMKVHTVESMLALGAALHAEEGSEWPLTWIERQHLGYNARYTFSSGELLTAIGASVLEQTSADLIADHLDGLASVGGSTVAFLSAIEPFFVGLQTPVWLSLDDLHDLAAWAAAALEASPGFSPVVAHAWAQSIEGGAVAWQYQGVHCAALALSGACLRRLLGRLEVESLPLVMATRLAVLDRVRERAATP